MPRKRKTPDPDLDDEQPGPAAPIPPRRSARTSAKVEAGPDAASSAPMSRSGGGKHHGKLRSSDKTLSDEALRREVTKMAKNEAMAEVMLLELMSAYSFSFPRLKELLTQNHLNVSLSKVKYVDIAPMVGLVPSRKGGDISSFRMFRARLPNSVFHKIIEDLDSFFVQYGSMDDHENEEARARYISGYFNKIITLFSGLLFNTPETVLDAAMTKNGRIEYQFKTFGGVTVVFIEVKVKIGTKTERLNFFAQVIAECDACSWMNYQDGYYAPILAVLCDGNDFYFFKFINRRRGNAPPQLFQGEFADGAKIINISNIERDPTTDLQTFFRKIRTVCDSLYYIFLCGYQSGLEAYWNQSVEKGKAEGKGRDSTPGWHKAKELARNALNVAVSAWDQYYEGNLEESKISAERAVQFLVESNEEAPHKDERKRPFQSYLEEYADL